MNVLQFLCYRYPHYKRPQDFQVYGQQSVVIVDSEKGNIIDVG